MALHARTRQFDLRGNTPVDRKSKANFIPPNQALLVISKALYGDEATLPEKSTDKFRDVWLVFRHALQNDDVKAIWFDEALVSRSFPNEWAAAEFFHLDNHDQRKVHLSGPNYPVLLEVDLKNLIKFLAENGLYDLKTTISAEKECQAYLIKLFESDEKIPKLDDLLLNIKKRFPKLSKSGFLRARKAAIVATDRLDLSRPGRPPVAKLTESNGKC